ncbi:peptidoglycan-binding protein [Patescibacteria group bacterium]|nr:peptidoglycan-binding protein [Patescibacteria group bacterium]
MKSTFVPRSIHMFTAAIIAASVLAFSVPLFAHAELVRQLEFGMSGSDVTELQTFLASDSTLYPEGLVTGYFGSLTKSAVARFQTRNGISAVGRVGPATLPVINAQMRNNTGSDVSGAVISNVGISTASTAATVSFSTNENTRATVYYSTQPLNVSETLNAVAISGASAASTDTTLRASQSISLSNLQPNTVYYYMAYTTDAAGNVSVTYPATFQTTQ